MHQKRFNIKKLVIVGGFFLLLFIIYNASIKVSRTGEIKIEIAAIPDDSDVYVNGRLEERKVLYIQPGEYTFSAHKDGFKDDSLKINVQEENVEVGLIPAPESTEAFRFLENNPEVQAKREAIGNQRSNKKGAQFEANNPIVSLLPVTDITGPFSIDYGQSKTRPNDIFLLVSDSSPSGRQNALKWISRHGYDPADFEIIFSDFTNPLETKRGGAL